MPLVGARLGCDVDCSAGTMACLSFHAIDGNDALLDVVCVGNVGHFLADAGRDTVYFKFVLEIGAATQINAVGGP